MHIQLQLWNRRVYILLYIVHKFICMCILQMHSLIKLKYTIQYLTYGLYTLIANQVSPQAKPTAENQAFRQLLPNIGFSFSHCTNCSITSCRGIIIVTSSVSLENEYNRYTLRILLDTYLRGVILAEGNCSSCCCSPANIHGN